jgi:hypothetical protein
VLPLALSSVYLQHGIDVNDAGLTFYSSTSPKEKDR